MKRTDTNVSTVRGLTDTSKSIVKIRRHTFVNQTSNVPRVTFNVPPNSGTKRILSLPTNIPEDQLEQFEMDSVLNSDYVDKAPKRDLVLKKKRLSPPSRPPKAPLLLSTDTETKEMYKLMSDFMAVEEKLNQLQCNLTRSGDERLVEIDLNVMMGRVEAGGRGEEGGLHTSSYDPFEYTEAHSTVSGAWGRQTRALALPSAEHLPETDVRSAISAIRSDLEEWRRTNHHSPGPSTTSRERPAASSRDLPSPKSEAPEDDPLEV